MSQTHRSQMQWASVSNSATSLADAIAQAADQLIEALGGTEPDLVLAFISSQHRAQFLALPMLFRREFETAQIAGCLGNGVIGGGHDLEDQPAIALVGAILPDVQLNAVHLEHHTTPPTYAERSLWDRTLNLHGASPECLMLLADPFSFVAEDFLKGLDRHYPTAAKLGGLASGVDHPGTPCLLLNEHVYASGCICLGMSGNIAVSALVAQGCRPIGEPMFANATHENLILELDGKAPRELLTELYQRIKRTDRKLFTDALFIGIAMEPRREQYQAGDFLIRTILGLDPDSGALLVNTHVPVHSVVQLHLRDSVTSSQDMEQLLTRFCTEHKPESIKGVLLFSCVWRGAEFYGHSDHDSNALRQHLGELPIGGIFCGGEIGPVRGTTHLHGFTSVAALIMPKAKLS